MSISKNSEQTSLTQSVSDEIFNTTVDLGIEYSELGLDDFLADGMLKEIPIIKTIYSVGKLGLSIKERFFVKKLLVFLKEFHSKTIDEQKINDFKFQFDTDRNYRNEVTEHLIVFTDSFLNIEKSKVFANLFRAYIYGHFSWNHFIHLSTCLNSINPKAFSFLEKLSEYDFKIAEDSNNRHLARDGESESLLYSCGIAYETSSWSSGFNVSQLGKDLFRYGVMKTGSL
jgi:hypothetical protein